MRILHPTDFSERASHAAEVAIALCLRLRASMVLIHVAEPPPIGEKRAASTDGLTERLERLALQYRQPGVPVEVRLFEGYAEDVIAVEAQRLEAGLIVLGTHSRSAPVRWLLGSVAERTLQSAEVPVLVVPDGSESFSAWAAGTRRLSVIVGLASAHPAERLVEVAHQFHDAESDVQFVHVAARSPLDDRLHGIVMRALRERLKAFETEGGTWLRIIDGDRSVAESIAAFASGHPCDLAVVGVHPHFGLDSVRTAEVARALLRPRIAPVLAIPLPMLPIAEASQAPSLRSILAATDLSELGNRAVSYAFAVADAIAGTVNVLHVHETAEGAPPLSAMARADLELRLHSLVPQLGTNRASTNVLIVDGPRPAQAIVDTATHLGADIICMGTHGRTALGRIVLGSVAEKVVHGFGRAVLLVR